MIVGGSRIMASTSQSSITLLAKSSHKERWCRSSISSASSIQLKGRSSPEALDIYGVAFKAIKEVLPPYVASRSVLLLLEVCEGFMVSNDHKFLPSSQLVHPLGQSFKF